MIDEAELVSQDYKIFDECVVCNAMKVADEEGRILSFNEMRELFDEQKKTGEKCKREKQIPLYTRFLLKYFPKQFFKKTAKEYGIDSENINSAMSLFGPANRIDVQPFDPGSRGFTITLNNNFKLWFVQDGDTFTFDGYEMGKYGNGDVTVFDK